MTKKIGTNRYIKVGTISKISCRHAGLRHSNVYISSEIFRNIESEYSEGLAKIGMIPMDYLRVILRQFNQIRQGDNDTYWFVLYPILFPKTKAASAQLLYSPTNKFWEIKTAIPMRIAEISKKKLIWTKSEPK